IIKSFYNKEGLKIQVKEAYEAEKNFEIIAEELNNVKKQKKIFEAEKENLDSIKDDINNREVFNYKLELLNKDEVELKEINENWPKYEMKISNIDEKIKFLEKNTNIEKIAKEINNVKKQKKIFEAEKENLDSIKDDINNREVFNYKLELLNKDEVELKEINENWPKYEMKISNIDEKIKFLEKN